MVVQAGKVRKVRVAKKDFVVLIKCRRRLGTPGWEDVVGCRQRVERMSSVSEVCVCAFECAVNEMAEADKGTSNAVGSRNVCESLESWCQGFGQVGE